MTGRGPWIAAGLAGMAGALILAVASWLEPTGSAPEAPKARSVDVGEVAGPGALRPDEARTGGNPLDAGGVSLQQGAWVQVADDSGRLSQQYSASRIDPERDRWMRMQEPRAVMFPDGGRVVTMRAEKGRLRVPQRAIESGRLDGQVVIRMYKPQGAAVVDTARDRPALVVEADEALFDNRLGEIRCDRRVKVVTDQLRFEGEGLTMLLTPDGRNIERLTVEKPLAPIEIVRRVERGAPALKPSGAVGGRGPSAQPDADAGSDPAPSQAASGPRFYRLTLDREVRVLRQGPDDLTRIEGDRLTAVFSLESNAIGSNLAAAPASVAMPGAWPLALASGVMAAGDAGVERIEIRYAGRLTMEVAGDPSDRLRRADDVRVDIQGAPARLQDQGSGARIDCGRLRYLTGDESMEIEGQPGRRFVLASPRLDLEAVRFSLDRVAGRGVIEGAGRMRLGGADGAAVQAAAQMPTQAVAAGQGQAPVADPVSGGARTVRLQWTQGVQLAFEPGSQAARLRTADFRGAVQADAEEVRLAAERLAVECVGKGSRDAVTRLLAEGAASAVRQPEGSSLSADRLQLDLEPLDDGASRPRKLAADGRVQALDKDQRLWTDAMECVFRETPGVAANAETVDLADVRTRGSVQALVSRDVRVWATSMDADPGAKKVTLKGPDLVLARGNVLADGFPEVRMDETSGVGTAPGAGRCRVFAQSLTDASAQPRPRPEPTASPTMVATWGDGLAYRRVDEQSSNVLLSGGVKANASRGPREQDDMQAREVVLTLAGVGAAAGAAGDTGALAGVRAMGDVTLESRAWGKDDRSDEPRLLQLKAEDVRHDPRTGEAEVPTAGTLLIFDRDDEGSRPQAPSLFDARGTTRFKWGKSLAMRQQGPADRFRIELDQGVELLHAGLRPQDTLTLTCDRLQATVQRDEKAAAGDLGAPVRLLRVEALGRVFVRTPDVDVECDTFDYDLHTHMATVGARPGRLVTVLQRGAKGQPIPVKAAGVVWDLETGRMQIRDAVGTGMR